jgi:membrane protease YdiL (CAAX protease family)
MKRIKSLLLRHPAAASVVLFGIFFVLSEIELDKWLMNWMDYQKASYLSGTLVQGGVSVLMVLLIAWLGLTREGGFTRPSQWKAVWLIWPLLVYSVLNGSDLIDSPLKINWADGGLIALFILLYISVGFIEEILFRGLILPLMLRQWGSTRSGVYKAVIISSAIFGLAHLANLVMGRRDLLTTTTQITYGIFFGVFFAALMLRNNSIWPAIFGHFLFDLCGNLMEITQGWVFTRKEPTTTVEGALITLAILLPLLLIGLFYLRKVKPVVLLPDPVNA